MALIEAFFVLMGLAIIIGSVVVLIAAAWTMSRYAMASLGRWADHVFPRR